MPRAKIKPGSAEIIFYCFGIEALTQFLTEHNSLLNQFIYLQNDDSCRH